MEENGRNGARLVNNLDADNRKTLLRGSCGLPSFGGVSGLATDRFHAVGGQSCDLDANEDFLRALSRANTALNGDEINVVIDSYRRIDDPDVFEQQVATGKIPLEEIARKSDELIGIRRADGETVFETKRHGVEVEARYFEDGDDFVAEYDSGGLRQGQLGEKIADDLMEQRIRAKMAPSDDVDDYVIKGFDADDVSDPGPDLIYKDPETGDIVVEEVKYISDDGNFGTRNLGSTKNEKVTQMDSEWIDNVVSERRGIDSETALKIRKAKSNDNLRKDISVIQNRKVDGGTILSDIADIGIDEIRLLKTGEVK